MSANALFIGAACIDVVIYLERLPKTEENVHPWKQTVSLGGCACNAARAARLVCDRITFAGPVGTGVFGELAERELAKSGLSVSIRTEKENGCCYCFVEDGGKSTFMSVHGGEYAFDREWMRDIDRTKYDYVYASGLEIEEPTGDALIDYLYEYPDRKVVYCPGTRGAVLREKNERLLKLHPILHLNKKESCIMAENLFHKQFSDWREAAKALQGITGETLVVTLGKDGAYAVSNDFKYLVPEVETTVVNAIGAGDTHAGVLIGSLCNGLSWKEALECANKWSAKAVATETAVPFARAIK